MDASRIIIQEIENLKKKHAKELANLKREMEEAAQARDKALREELKQEQRALEAKITRLEQDRVVSMKTLEELRRERASKRDTKADPFEGFEELRRQQTKNAFSVLRVAVVGATEIDRSTTTFIRHLSQGHKFHVGWHYGECDPPTFQANYYTDETTGCHVILLDMPPFDGQISQSLMRFLQPHLLSEEGTRTCIIYTHDITDLRMHDLTQETIRTFQTICDRKRLSNVRIVTTNWGQVTRQEGMEQEDALKRGVFRTLLQAGAQMRRHDNTVESARRIMSELVSFPEFSNRFQDELGSGKPLEDMNALLDRQERMELRMKQELAEMRAEVANRMAQLEAAVKQRGWC